MTKVNFAASRKRAEEAGLIGGGKFKPAEGDNRFRLVSECIENPSVYEGKKRFQWLCFVLDRKDGQVKPYFMPVTVYSQIEALQDNPDYRFDEVPMPYDVTLNAKGAGNKEVVYTILPARSNVPLTPAELELVAKAGSIRDFQGTLTGQNGDGPVDGPGYKEPTIQVDEAPLPPEPPPGRYDSVPPQFRPPNVPPNSQSY